MSNIELALTNLGEVTSVEFHKKNNSNGINELKVDTNKAGNVIKTAKDVIEKELGEPVVTSSNYIDLTNNNDAIDFKNN